MASGATACNLSTDIQDCLHQLDDQSGFGSLCMQVAICDRQVMVTWLCPRQEQLASVHEAFQSLIR